jgi:hypothetical protein
LAGSLCFSASTDADFCAGKIYFALLIKHRCRISVMAALAAYAKATAAECVQTCPPKLKA